jgi:hypothetical protein
MEKSKNRRSRHSGVVELPKRPPVAEPAAEPGAESGGGPFLILFAGGLFILLAWKLIEAISVGGFCGRSCQYWWREPWTVGFVFIVMLLLMIATGAVAWGAFKSMAKDT